jgi:hypothetical protein
MSVEKESREIETVSSPLLGGSRVVYDPHAEETYGEFVRRKAVKSDEVLRNLKGEIEDTESEGGA